MKHVQGSRGKKNCKLLIGTTKISFRFEQLATGLFSSGVYVCMYVSRSVLSLERPPGPRSLGKGREKKEFNRSRRWNKKNVKSTDTHRGGLEAPEESI